MRIENFYQDMQKMFFAVRKESDVNFHKASQDALNLLLTLRDEVKIPKYHYIGIISLWQNEMCRRIKELDVRQYWTIPYRCCQTPLPEGTKPNLYREYHDLKREYLKARS